MTEPIDVYIAAPSAADWRPRVRAFFDAVAKVPGCRVAHDWPAIMDAHGKADAHLPEHTLHTEALADLAGVRRARIFVVLTGATDDVGMYGKPATSGGALVELGVVLGLRHVGARGAPVIIQSGETWPHPLFGALVDHRFETDALTLAWLAGYALASKAAA